MRGGLLGFLAAALAVAGTAVAGAWSVSGTAVLDGLVAFDAADFSSFAFLSSACAGGPPRGQPGSSCSLKVDHAAGQSSGRYEAVVTWEAASAAWSTLDGSLQSIVCEPACRSVARASAVSASPLRLALFATGVETLVSLDVVPSQGGLASVSTYPEPQSLAWTLRHVDP
jgi:hypothetical protein